LLNAAVQHLQNEMSAANYSGIWDEADDRFRKAVPKEEFSKLFEAIHRKLGNADSADLVNIFVNAGTYGTFITTNYQTKFTRGPATESFVWIKSGNRLSLVRYDVRSNALIVNQ